jgi:NAD-dependent SIR2 family protein deacetylase
MNLGKLDFLISQNVDGLHLESGIPSDKLAELHGNHNLWWCLDCHAKFTKDEIGWDERKWGRGYRTEKVGPGMPTCPKCGGIIRSSIVNFGDPLPPEDLAKAVAFSREADVFLSIGTSLKVTPAADLPNYALRHGAKFVLINQGKTPFDNRADIRIWEVIGEVVPPLVDKVKGMLEN